MSPLVQIAIDWPDAKLNPNRSRGRFWGATHAAKKAAVDAAYLLARAHVGALPPSGPLAAVITLEPPDGRRRDVDNVLAALKPTLDGLARAVGYDDSRVQDWHIRWSEPCRPAGRVTIAVHPGGQP